MPIILLINLPASANAHLPLGLQASVLSTSTTPLAGLTYSWICDLVLDLSDLSVISGIAHRSTLSIRPFALTPGFFTFTLTVCDPQYVNACTSASAAILINVPPSGGSCFLLPTSGVSLETNFVATCANWQDPAAQAPLQYQFEYFSPTLLTQLLTSLQSQPSATFFLPPGAFIVRVRISNQLGAQTLFTMAVSVAANPLALPGMACYVQSQIATLLAAALAQQSALTASLIIADLAMVLNSAVATGASAVCSSGSVYTPLFHHLSSLANSSSLPCGFLAQTLLPLTVHPSALYADENLALAIRLNQQAIRCVGEPNTNVTLIALELSQSSSNLLLGCSQLNLVGSMMQSLLLASVAGSSQGAGPRTLTSTQVNATVTRTPLSAGATILVNGVTVLLSPEVTAGLASSLSPVSLSTLDSASSTGIAAIDTTIITFARSWSICRPATGSGLITQITVTIDDEPIDFAKLTGPISFDLPVNLSTAADESGCVPSAEALECSHYDPFTDSFSSSGCLTGAFSPATGSVNCQCSHLTEFLILYNEALAKESCRTIGGDLDYLIFMILYILVGCVSFGQLMRITYAGGCFYWLMCVEHSLLVAYCVFRAVNQFIFYKLAMSMEISTQALISGLPYVLLPWIFTFSPKVPRERSADVDEESA
jgi:hypothetical protein